MKKWTGAWLVIVGLAMVMSPSVAAASSQTTAPAGITLAPFLQTVSVASFEPTKSFKLLVTNQTDSTRSFRVSLTDFGAQNEFGGVAFLGLTDSNYVAQHGLVKWLVIDQSSFSLAPKASTSLTVTIRNDEGLAPGGHYGAVLVNEATGSGQSKPNTIAANPTVSSLIFVTKLGGEQYDLRLNKVTHNTSWLHLPTAAHLRFQNPGNVAVVPRGTVQLFGPHNTLIGQGAINEDSSFILPDAYRQLTVPIRSVGSAGWWPEHYTLQVNYRYDGLAVAATRTEKFYFINLPHLLVSLTVILILTIALYYYRPVLWITLKKLRFHP